VLCREAETQYLLRAIELTSVGAAGVLTHLGLEVGVNQHGVVLGTTTTRAIEMAREAGVALAVVFP
jgi:hypothetical protein